MDGIVLMSNVFFEKKLSDIYTVIFIIFERHSVCVVLSNLLQKLINGFKNPLQLAAISTLSRSHGWA